MAEFRTMVITNKGQALIAKMLSGSATINFTKISLSDTQYTDAQLIDLITLNGVKQTTGISRIIKTSNVAVQVEGAVTNSSLETGYYIRTIALYAQDPDEGEIVYAACGASIPGWMPPFNGVSTSGCFLKLVTTVQNASSVTITVDPGAVATIGDIQDLQSQVDDLQSLFDISVFKTTTSLTYYVNASTGSDNNDGLSVSNAFKTIQHAVDILPKYLIHDVTINVAEGTYNETVDITAFGGYGKLNINGANSLSDVEDYVVNRINVSSNSAKVVIIGFSTNYHYGFFVTNSPVSLSYCYANTNEVIDDAAGFVSYNNGNMILTNCKVNNYYLGCLCHYNSFITINNIEVSNVTYGFYSSEGGVLSFRTEPTITSLNTNGVKYKSLNGGIIINTKGSLIGSSSYTLTMLNGCTAHQNKVKKCGNVVYVDLIVNSPNAFSTTDVTVAQLPLELAPDTAQYFTCGVSDGVWSTKGIGQGYITGSGYLVLSDCNDKGYQNARIFFSYIL